jgi:hypothetical protein
MPESYDAIIRLPSPNGCGNIPLANLSLNPGFFAVLVGGLMFTIECEGKSFLTIRDSSSLCAGPITTGLNQTSENQD